MNAKRPIVALVAIFSLVFLYIPSVAVAVFSVNDAKFGLVWRGFTWKWYEQLFQNEIILEAAMNSLFAALVSTLMATILGTALALGLDRFPWPKRLSKIMDLIIHLPVVTPDIILAAALVLTFSVLRQISSSFDMGMGAMILGHITFQISFVTLVVRSRLASLGRDIDEAARDLYASGRYLFFHVTLPLLMPGILAGAMLAFTLSLDDFIIISPEIHALSTLVLLVTVIMVIAAERISRFRKD